MRCLLNTTLISILTQIEVETIVIQITYKKLGGITLY